MDAGCRRPPKKRSFPSNAGERNPAVAERSERRSYRVEWAGLAVFGTFVFGFLIYILKVFNDSGGVLHGVLVTVLIFGPMFGVIAWATRRNLRKIESSRHKSRQEKL
jgi:Na+-driven multidrug efflux pump